MAFRKLIAEKRKPKTVRELVTLYGDGWFFFCASEPISQGVWMGDRMRCDYYDQLIMSQCERGERERIRDCDIRD